MRHTKNQFLLVLSLLLSLLGWTSAGWADNYVTKISTGSGANWNGAIWSNAPTGLTNASAPVAGNTYEMLANGTVWGNNTGNTRQRNPATDGLQTFPGDSLKLNANTDIRFKRGAATTAISATISSFPGVGGNPGLILNGGVLNPGDDSIFIVTGKVQVAGQSILSSGDNGGGAQKELRSMYLRGTLMGSGNLVILQSGQGSAHQTDADGSAYTGTWIVQAGFLKGLTPTSLGVGSIIVAPTNQLAAANGTNFSKVEFMYDWNTTGFLALSNNPVSGAAAVCVLHQNVSVAALLINGVSQPIGTYPWATLNANFPANFPAGGSGQISVVPPSPPLAPLNVSAVGGDAQVTLGWSLTANAEGYLIKRSDTDGGPYTTINSTGGTSFVDTGLVNGNLYYYVVAATNSLGSSADSLQVTGTPNLVVTGITAVGGTNQVALGWNVLAGAASYSVLRSSTPSGFSTLASGVASSSYLDTAVLSGRTYYYKVSASLTGGSTSAPSATVTGTTAPGTPTLTSVLFASTVIRLGWATEPVVSQFAVERSTDGVNFSPLVTLAGTATSYTNTGLAPTTAYSYRVQASNATGPSGYSNGTTNSTPSVGYNVNFGCGADNSGNAGRISPIPPGYLNDIGDVFGDRTNGFFYGWTTLGGTNVVRDARWRQNGISPDLRYDTFMHLMKANTADPSVGAIWEIQVPNGPYLVHIVSGESDNADGTYVFDVEGTISPIYNSAGAVGIAHWGDMTVSCGVSDGRLTIKSAPGAINNKIAFVDIYPDIPVAPVIGTDPLPLTVEEYRRATFTVGLSAGSAPLSYQWYKGIDLMPGEINRTLTFTNARMSDIGDYSVIVTNYGGSVTSMTARLTVYADTNPPVVVSVGSLDGMTIGLCFSEEVSDANTAVSDNFSYSLNGNPMLSPVSVVIRPDRKSVLLLLNPSDPPLSGPFTVDVTGEVKDLAGHTIEAAGSHAAGVVGGFTTGDVGAPTLAGSHFTCDSATIEMIGGGGDYWNTSDQAYVVTKPITGDFEASVRVVALTGANAITKAVLAARETRNADSRGYHLSVNPTPPGRDLVEMGFRDVTTGASALVGTTYTPAGVPNAWMRLTRIGNTFTGYRSTNGVNWVALGTNTPASPYPATMAVGVSLTAHDNNLTSTGTFNGLQINGLVGSQFVSEVYNAGTFTAGFQTRNGFTYVVEYKNTVDAPWTTLGNPIAGDGTVKTFTDPGPVSPTDHRIYRVSYR